MFQSVIDERFYLYIRVFPSVCYKEWCKNTKKDEDICFCGCFLCLITCYFTKYVYLCSRNYK
jgi:hypothetical protein